MAQTEAGRALLKRMSHAKALWGYNDANRTIGMGHLTDGVDAIEREAAQAAVERLAEAERLLRAWFVDEGTDEIAVRDEISAFLAAGSEGSGE